MKRFLFPALVLCAALATACNPSSNSNNSNSNGGGNQNTANINQGIVNGNKNAVTTATPDPKNKAVMITVWNDSAGNPQISVAPNSMYMSKGKSQKLRFYVFNDLDADITGVKIEFKTDNPMDGSGYTFGTIPAGNDDKSTPQGINGGTTVNKKYPYKVTVNVSGVGSPITLDPDVEVGP
jgi:hypothetical protein